MAFSGVGSSQHHASPRGYRGVMRRLTAAAIGVLPGLVAGLGVTAPVRLHNSCRRRMRSTAPRAAPGQRRRRAVLFVAPLAVAAMWCVPAQASFPGRNGRLALALGTPAGPGGPTTIATVNPDGSHMRRLRVGAEPVWTPDGRRMEFVRLGGPERRPWEMASMAADGTQLRTHTVRDAQRRRPVLIYSTSPDGRRIAYSVRLPHSEADGWALYVARLDGSRARRVITTQGHYDYLASIRWSPNGRTLACVEGQFRLWTVAATGHAARVLAGDPQSVQADGPSWSPDGERLLLHLGEPVPDLSGVAVLRPPSPDLQLLAAGGRSPVWSPDGTKIAYLVPVDQINTALTVANSDGSDPRVILTAHIDAIDWQPRP
jgi:Tol biopolymer transport system component